MAVFDHFSVAEYLEQTIPGEWRIDDDYFSPLQAQLALTQSCFAYITHTEQRRRYGWSTYPFREYAWRYWSYHAAGYLKAVDKTAERPQDRSSIRPEIYFAGASTLVSPLALRLCNLLRFPTLYPDIQGSLVLKRKLREIAESLERLEPVELECLFDDWLSRRRHVVMKEAARATDLVYEEQSGPYSRGVRLLIVEPSPEHGDQISTWLLADSLDNYPQYEALSYAWGTQTDKVDLLVNDTTLPVTRGLYAALRNLRKTTKPSVFWVDQVSINQRDVSEQTHGVGALFITGIFSQASRIIAWLGDASYEVTSAMQSFAESAQDRDFDADTKEGELLLSGINRIFECEIWRRTWAIQEIALAKDLVIQWGSWQIPFNSLERLTSLAAIPAIHFFRSLVRLRDRSHPPSFAKLLYLLRHLLCTDERDKVYSIISMLSKEERALYKDFIDFSTNVDRRHSRVAVALCGLDMLSINPVDQRIGLELPSWAPVWTKPLYDCPLAGVKFNPSQQELFNAGSMSTSNSVPSFFNCIQADRKLPFVEAHGVVVDTVHYTNIRWEPGVTKLREKWPVSQTPVKGYESQEQMKRILLEGRISCEDGHFRRYNPEHGTDTEATMDREISVKLGLRGNRTNRHLFATRMGYIGNGPTYVSKGDVVVIFFGAKVPHLLREVTQEANGRASENHDSYYSLIGEW